LIGTRRTRLLPRCETNGKSGLRLDRKGEVAYAVVVDAHRIPKGTIMAKYLLLLAGLLTAAPC
jgi:hypothetical protein